jgi:hypothetical protein
MLKRLLLIAVACLLAQSYANAVVSGQQDVLTWNPDGSLTISAWVYESGCHPLTGVTVGTPAGSLVIGNALAITASFANTPPGHTCPAWVMLTHVTIRTNPPVGTQAVVFYSTQPSVSMPQVVTGARAIALPPRS